MSKVITYLATAGTKRFFSSSSNDDVMDVSTGSSRMKFLPGGSEE
jgi:hypothetical protein